MDARVNDFLNEIDEISPLNENDCVWEKCYDETSHYHYYWNTRTNEVTWEMPPEFKNQSKVRKKPLYVPPRTAPLFPSTSKLPPIERDAIKIYKIADSGTSSDRVVTKIPLVEPKREVNITPKKKSEVILNRTRRKSDSDDEKIILISSYGGDTDESDEDQVVEEKEVNGTQEAPQKTEKTSNIPLVVGYSDSEEEEEEEVVQPPPPPPKPIEGGHSILFPAPAQIDVRDFDSPPIVTPRDDQEPVNKAFQRKKRIGVSLVNSGRKPPPKTNDGDESGERKGLGFHGDGEDTEAKTTYSGFKSGGMMFVKSDVLNPISDELPKDDAKDLQDSYQTLKEKLTFLGEANEAVPPVQVMLIQLETLNVALKSGDLKSTYLQKWLAETCSNLIKVEKEATPEGWLLEWDRTHKRYYYRNASTDQCQWEYPTLSTNDVTVCDDAMDICTTPPPPNIDEDVVLTPPPPPKIHEPSPPPPPIITDTNIKGKNTPVLKNTEETTVDNGEPLPPGVDPDVKKTQDPEKKDLNDVLSSFYSDIAAIENDSPKQSEDSEQPNTEEPPKKKKKTKVKLAQGLAMKKKGVSKLVEKWKNVQMSYND